MQIPRLPSGCPGGTWLCHSLLPGARRHPAALLPATVRHHERKRCPTLQVGQLRRRREARGARCHVPWIRCCPHGGGGGGGFLPTTQPRRCPGPGSGAESRAWSRGPSWPITPPAPLLERGSRRHPGGPASPAEMGAGLQVAASKAGTCRHRDLRSGIGSVGAAAQTWRGPVSRLSQQQASRARGGSPVPLTLGRGAEPEPESLGQGGGSQDVSVTSKRDQDHPPAPTPRRERTWARSSGVGKAGQVQAPRTDGRRDRGREAAVPGPPPARPLSPTPRARCL